MAKFKIPIGTDPSKDGKQIGIVRVKWSSNTSWRVVQGEYRLFRFFRLWTVHPVYIGEFDTREEAEVKAATERATMVE